MSGHYQFKILKSCHQSVLLAVDMPLINSSLNIEYKTTHIGCWEYDIDFGSETKLIKLPLLHFLEHYRLPLNKKYPIIFGRYFSSHKSW